MSELAEKLITENIRSKNPVLDLGYCGLEGTEDELYKPLRDATHLKTLIFSEEWRSLEEDLIDNTASLKKSQNNGFDWNEFSSIPSLFPTTIKKLVLNGDEDWSIQDYSVLKNLHKLEVLYLRGNNIEDIYFLENLKKLKVFLNFNKNTLIYTLIYLFIK